MNGQRRSLPPGLDLVVYRVVQEALTNAIKHAGPTQARVKLTFGVDALELEVSDSGRGPALDVGDGHDHGSGHGLIGMSDRVKMYGGELKAGPRAGGGFEVRARIPLTGSVRAPATIQAPAVERQVGVAVGDRMRWRWLDWSLAGVFLVALELDAVTSGEHRVTLAASMLIVAVITLACVWRRRAPLGFLVLVVALVFPLSGGPLAPSSSIWTAIYVGLIPPYAVAAWENRRNALIGLGIIVCAPAVGELVLNHQGLGNYAGAAFVICAAWSAGRAIRARRTLNSRLQRTSERLAAERDDRVQLAVAAERSRIAREQAASCSKTYHRNSSPPESAPSAPATRCSHQASPAASSHSSRPPEHLLTPHQTWISSPLANSKSSGSSRPA
jgi:signal transduction histidine kinase